MCERLCVSAYECVYVSECNEREYVCMTAVSECLRAFLCAFWCPFVVTVWYMRAYVGFFKRVRVFVCVKECSQMLACVGNSVIVCPQRLLNVQPPWIAPPALDNCFIVLPLPCGEGMHAFGSIDKPPLPPSVDGVYFTYPLVSFIVCHCVFLFIAAFSSVSVSALLFIFHCVFIVPT